MSCSRPSFSLGELLLRNRLEFKTLIMALVLTGQFVLLYRLMQQVPLRQFLFMGTYETSYDCHLVQGPPARVCPIGKAPNVTVQVLPWLLGIPFRAIW